MTSSSASAPAHGPDFIEHTKDACWDLQFYSEWCLNHGVEQDPVVSAFINILVTFRRLVRAGVAPDGELRAFDVGLAINANSLAKAVDDTIPSWQPPNQEAGRPC